VRIPIRWRDIDALGHVNNAVYLTYLEELLNGYLGPVFGDDWVTARTELDFRREIRLGDGEVVTEAGIERVVDARVTIRVVLTLLGTVALEGRVVVVAWDPELRRSRSLTDGKRQALAELGS
jgi:acyl-CoA thioester hydrolase